MSKKASVSSQIHLLTRKNPTTGYAESLVYTGTLRDKPAGWLVVRSNLPRPY